MSSDQNAGCLGYIRDYTTQLYRDYFISHEIKIRSSTNEYNGHKPTKLLLASLLSRKRDEISGP